MKQIGIQRQYQTSDDGTTIDINEAKALDIILKNDLLNKDKIKDLEQHALAGDENVKDEIRQLQKNLKADGKYDGPIDGIPGKGTAKGIDNLLKENGSALLKMAGKEVEHILDKSEAGQNPVIAQFKDALELALSDGGISYNEADVLMKQISIMPPSIMNDVPELNNVIKEISTAHDKLENEVQWKGESEDKQVKPNTASLIGLDLKSTKDFIGH